MRLRRWELIDDPNQVWGIVHEVAARRAHGYDRVAECASARRLQLERSDQLIVGGEKYCRGGLGGDSWREIEELQGDIAGEAVDGSEDDKRPVVTAGGEPTTEVPWLPIRARVAVIEGRAGGEPPTDQETRDGAVVAAVGEVTGPAPAIPAWLYRPPSQEPEARSTGEQEALLTWLCLAESSKPP